MREPWGLRVGKTGVREWEKVAGMGVGSQSKAVGQGHKALVGDRRWEPCQEGMVWVHRQEGRAWLRQKWGERLFISSILRGNFHTYNFCSHTVNPGCWKGKPVVIRHVAVGV